jgi:hypothetical protein
MIGLYHFWSAVSVIAAGFQLEPIDEQFVWPFILPPNSKKCRLLGKLAGSIVVQPSACQCRNSRHLQRIIGSFREAE